MAGASAAWGQSTGSLAFSSSTFTVEEDAGSVSLPIVRTGGSNGTASATVTVANGTARLGADFGNLTSPFPLGDGTTGGNVQIPIVNTAGLEGAETFTVSLSTPTNGATLGAAKVATVRILDAADVTSPSAPLVTYPAAGALVDVATGGSISVKGTASDNQGISAVKIKLNNGSFVDASIAASGAASSGYALSITPATGLNTLTVQSFDHRGNPSPQIVRTFTTRRPLAVIVNAAQGSVSPGYAPASSYRTVGSRYTIVATAKTSPAPGYVFDGWAVSGGPTLEEMGVTPAALELRTLTFTMREGLVLTPRFIPNPFAALAGTYNGLVRPSASLPPPLGTSSNISTEGFFNATVQATGAFSVKLRIDGLILGSAGVFDNTGNARFGTSRTTTITVARPNKPSVILDLFIDLTQPGGTQKITGTITQNYRSVITAVSQVEADRAAFNGTTSMVPPDYLAAANANATYTAVIQPQNLSNQPPPLTEFDFPQGASFATVTVTKTGIVTLAGTLADGTTPVTISSALSKDLTVPLFAQLYSNRGFFGGVVKLDRSQHESDMAAATMLWSRPFQDVQHYAYGWPEVIKVSLRGARYVAAPGTSVILSPDGIDPGDLGDPLPLPDPEGNVKLELTGPFMPPTTKKANLNSADVVSKIPVNDPSFTLAIARASGTFSGTFARTDNGTKPSFRGVIYQKGSATGGMGYFLTVAPAVKTYDGQSGLVRLRTPEPPDDTAPAVPTAVAVTYDDGAFTLNWTSPADSDLGSINVYRGTSMDNLSLFATLLPGTTSYTDAALQNGTTYFYALSSTDTAGNESPKTLAVLAEPEGPFDIYVDSVSGDDSHEGTSASEPLRTLAAARAAAVALGHGVSIGLRRGSFWREALNLGVQNHVSVSAYGVGAPPVVTAFDVKPTWTQDQTFPNLWYVDIAHDGFGSERPTVLDNSSLMYRRLSLSSANDSDGSYYSAHSSSANPLRVYINPVGDPNSDGHTYEVTTRSYAVYVGDDAKVTGVVGRGAIHAGGPLRAGINSTLRRCVAAYGTKHNILLGSGLIEDCVMYDADAASELELGVVPLVVFANDATGLSATMKRLLTYTTRPIASIVYNHTLNDPATSHENMTCDSCIGYLAGGGSAFEGGVANHFTIKNSAVYGAVNSAVSVYAGMGIIEHLLASQVSDSHNMVYGPKAIWRQVAIERSGAPTGSKSPITISEGSEVTIDHASISTPATYFGDGVGWVNANGGSVSINRSIIAANNVLGIPSLASYEESNHNAFARTGLGPFATYHGSPYNLPDRLGDFRAATSQDGNSVALTSTPFSGNPALGDFRIVPSTLTTAGHDGDAGVTEHWDYNLRRIVPGPPERWPVIPITYEESFEYILHPEAWDFYP